jgi:hypothetical protein
VTTADDEEGDDSSGDDEDAPDNDLANRSRRDKGVFVLLGGDDDDDDDCGDAGMDDAGGVGRSGEVSRATLVAGAGVAVGLEVGGGEPLLIISGRFKARWATVKVAARRT